MKWKCECEVYGKRYSLEPAKPLKACADCDLYGYCISGTIHDLPEFCGVEHPDGRIYVWRESGKVGVK